MEPRGLEEQAPGGDSGVLLVEQLVCQMSDRSGRFGCKSE